jgi:cyclopropane fatty-acyl-phospholipid synthase-like methyltransferase
LNSTVSIRFRDIQPMMRARQRWQQASYLMSAVLGRFDHRRTHCPHCGSADVEVLSHKWVVTSLVKCRMCALRFRVPQGTAQHHSRFYQRAYRSGLATDCPTPDECRRMMENRFAGTEKNFAHRIEVTAALGVAPGSRLLDYGASWGYGTWQFRQAGYDASGYEISRPRAAYARDQLAVPVLDEISQVSGPFDCMFSCHVLEHLPTPRLALDLAARVLRPGGLFLAFTPNGSETCRQAVPEKYDHSWGRLHPLYLDDAFYRSQSGDRPHLLCSGDYGAHYPLESLRQWDRRSAVTLDLSRRELLFAAVF